MVFSLIAILDPINQEHLKYFALAALRDLRARFALGRRFFRVFRFAESFAAAHALYVATPPGEGGVETWLEISARSFNGMYLLLETLHFPEALAVEGLSVWGPQRAGVLHVEGQRFWFLALACAVAVGGLKLRRLGGEGGGVVVDGKGERKEEGEEKEKERERERETEKRRDQSQRVLRRMIADVLDLAVPGAVVGWVPASPGTVGILMLVSTWLTGLEVWERCGREIDAARAK